MLNQFRFSVKHYKSVSAFIAFIQKEKFATDSYIYQRKMSIDFITAAVILGVWGPLKSNQVGNMKM